MPNWFNRPLKMPSIKHSVHDLSNDYKTSMQIGMLTPVGVEEILPSDKLLTHTSEVFIRFAPLKFPVMHKIKVHTSNFFVPFRIVLGEDLYEEFLNNNVNIQPAVVKSSAPNQTFLNSVFDYLGYDIEARYTEGLLTCLRLDNPLAFFGYLCICRDWYCDSNLQNSIMDEIDTIINTYRDCVKDGISYTFTADALVSLFNVAYTKDYFNTARPTPQLGSEMKVLNSPLHVNFRGSEAQNLRVGGTSTIRGTLVGRIYANDGIYEPLSDTTTIRDLWKKEMLQRYFEIGNTFGTRIREYLAGHYGVRYSDQRIQIPMYCGGSSSYAQISEVMSHSDTEGAALGQYSGKAIVADKSHSRKEYFEEHGYYISLLSLIPDNGYCNGQQRTFFKQNIFDFASPEFNNVGWQEIYLGELYASSDDDENRKAWGYQPRYSEYRSHPSRCTGLFRGLHPEVAYHLNRQFFDIPPLNGNFIKVSDVNRIFSSTDVSGSFSPLYVDVYHHMFMSRPISYEPGPMHLY